MLLVFLDTETSGLVPTRHRILEIAFRVLDSENSKPLISYESVIFQPADVWAARDPKSEQIHGLSWENIVAGKSEDVVTAEIIGELTGVGLGKKPGVFICQNPSFDRVFFSQIINEEMQNDYKWPYHWLDLASMFWISSLQKKKSITDEASLSKDQIAHALGLPKEKWPHRAMRGVDHLIACYQALLSGGFISGA